jgi:hypothetical protein
LITPVALEDGSRFAIREGGLTVGAGVITKIVEYGANLNRQQCRIDYERKVRMRGQARQCGKVEEYAG